MRVVSMSTSRRTQLHGQWKTIRGCGDGDCKSRLMRNEKKITEESSELHILQSMLLEKSDETNLIASFGESAWSFITLLSKPEMVFPLWINYGFSNSLITCSMSSTYGFVVRETWFVSWKSRSKPFSFAHTFEWCLLFLTERDLYILTLLNNCFHAIFSIKKVTISISLTSQLKTSPNKRLIVITIWHASKFHRH